MNKEKLINQIMKECENDGEPVTRTEAEEMAEMEMKAKKDCRRYESDVKKRKPTNHTIKVDKEKVEIIKSVAHQLTRFIICNSESLTYENYEGAENITIVNPQREITFNVGENEYSLTLTKHRKKK